MILRRSERPILKTPDEVRCMREAGLRVAEVLAALSAMVRPGVTTGQLNEAAGERIRALGGVPSFLGYVVDGRRYPANICVSIDDEVVHGIPGRCQHGRRVVPDRALCEGQVISIDCGVIFDGWQGDSAVTLPVGEVPGPVSGLLDACRGALWAGLRAVRPGARLSDVAAAIEGAVRAAEAASGSRYGLVEDYVGHGIGRALHEPPQVPNYVSPQLRRQDLVLQPGLVIAIEPMVNLGTKRTRTLRDGWTVVTKDGQPSAHFEHTVAVTEAGYEVLTLRSDGTATH